MSLNKHMRKNYFHKVTVLLICAVLILVCSGCSFKKAPEDSSITQSTFSDNDSSASTSNNEDVSDITTTDNGQGTDLAPTDSQIQDENEDDEENANDENVGILWHPDNSWVFVNNSWLNIRNGPSTDNAIMTEVYHAQALRRTAVSDYWSEIVLPDGRTGYAYNSYLSLTPVRETEIEQ